MTTPELTVSALADADARVVCCGACQGEGRIIHEVLWNYDPRTGDPVGFRSEEWCPYCDGTGGEITATAPVGIDDLPALVPQAECWHTPGLLQTFID